ncbi:hypothetical protein U9M48_016161 [Paspalum notatum var. saurae]|uniref:Uncharacterized protein n=1 Tax=Paspalum notatum var. saurae TaxID=547442 RepID=A0AAQ3WMJ8_PASNO
MKPSAIGSAVRGIRHVGDHVTVARYSRVTLHEISKEHGAKLIMEVETAPNPLGACALALVDDGAGGQGFVLACPSPTIRETQIWRKGWGAPLHIIVSDAATTVIHCMAFSHDSKWLLVSSDQGAVHVCAIKVNLTPLTSDELHDDDEPAASTSASLTL